MASRSLHLAVLMVTLTCRGQAATLPSEQTLKNAAEQTLASESCQALMKKPSTQAWQVFTAFDALATRWVKRESVTEKEKRALQEALSPIMLCQGGALISAVSNLNWQGPKVSADLKFNVQYDPTQDSLLPKALHPLKPYLGTWLSEAWEWTPKAHFKFAHGQWVLDNISLK